MRIYAPQLSYEDYGNCRLLVFATLSLQNHFEINIHFKKALIKTIQNQRHTKCYAMNCKLGRIQESC